MFVELVQSEEQRQLVYNLLDEVGLSYDQDITSSLLLYEESTLVGTVSLSVNIIKCLAISPQYQHKGLALTLVSKAISYLHSMDITHYFAYTKVEQKKVFESMGFRALVQVDDIVLLEGGSEFIETYLQKMKESNQLNGSFASLVMNLNPMTNGHLFLIEKAAKENKQVLLFVVEEDLSHFPFSLRFAIAKDATKHLKNVTVVRSGPYMVSRSTFSTYFMKDKLGADTLHAKIDFAVFLKYYVPIFEITKRYVGTEPYCRVTSEYNRIMLDSTFPIVLVDRKTQDDLPISASFVRKKLEQGEDIKSLVPEVCYEQLRQYFGS